MYPGSAPSRYGRSAWKPQSSADSSGAPARAPCGLSAVVRAESSVSSCRWRDGLPVPFAASDVLTAFVPLLSVLDEELWRPAGGLHIPCRKALPCVLNGEFGVGVSVAGSRRGSVEYGVDGGAREAGLLDDRGDSNLAENLDDERPRVTAGAVGIAVVGGLGDFAAGAFDELVSFFARELGLGGARADRSALEKSVAGGGG